MSEDRTPEPWRMHYAHPTSWEQDFASLSVPDMFAASVRAHGSSPLVEFGNELVINGNVQSHVPTIAH